jgi:hypothetical protein
MQGIKGEIKYVVIDSEYVPAREVDATQAIKVKGGIQKWYHSLNEDLKNVGMNLFKIHQDGKRELIFSL